VRQTRADEEKKRSDEVQASRGKGEEKERRGFWLVASQERGRGVRDSSHKPSPLQKRERGGEIDQSEWNAQRDSRMKGGGSRKKTLTLSPGTSGRGEGGEGRRRGSGRTPSILSQRKRRKAKELSADVKNPPRLREEGKRKRRE